MTLHMTLNVATGDVSFATESTDVWNFTTRNLYALCERKFISRNPLNIHIKRHTGKILYKCAMWQKDFQEPHKETHENVC